MSGIDMSNPKVAKNFFIGQAKEGKGKFSVKEKVVIFTNNEGHKVICPDEMQEEMLKKLGHELPKEKKILTEEEKSELTKPEVKEDKKEEKLADAEHLKLLKEEAKKLGIKGYATMKESTLKTRINETKKSLEERKEPEMIDLVITQEDLDNNPELVEKGVKVGETIQVPKTE